MSKVFEKAYKG